MWDVRRREFKESLPGYWMEQRVDSEMEHRGSGLVGGKGLGQLMSFILDTFSLKCLWGYPIGSGM